MERTRLRFECLQQIVGTSEMSVLMLTDETRKRALTLVCDELMTHQLMMRLNKPEVCKTMLPEVLIRMMASENLEMVVLGIFDGQYQVILMDMMNGTTVRVRMSDAVLLTLVAQVPLYIEENLMKRQSVAFNEHATGVAIPINTMDTDSLRMALDHAVEEENYELASQLRDEINSRSDNKS